MRDGLVVAACADSRDAFDRVREYVDTNEFSPMAAFWWPIVSRWYERDPDCERADRAILREHGKRKAGSAHVETLVGWWDDLPDSVSADNVVAELLEVKRIAVGNQLAASMGEDVERLLPVAKEYVDLLEATDLVKDTWVEATDDDDIEHELDESGKIKVLPMSLNARLRGGCPRGTHIMVFGPTEIGKSMVAVNMVSGFLRQGLRVLYVSNEDPAVKIRGRIRSNLAAMSADQIKADADEARRRSKLKGIDNLFVGNMDPGDVRQIERLVDRFGADVIVIDQLRNLHAAGSRKSDGTTQRIDAAAQEVRALLIRKQLVGISIMQAYAGEHGKPTVWFHAQDVDSSRVGAPGAADVLLGIGADEEMLLQNVRAISLCKNKVGGNHEGFTVKVSPKLSKVK